MSIRETTVIKTPETKVWTDAEFMALPDDGNRYELVKGELINLGNSGALHGYIAILLSAALFGLVTSRKLGVLLDSSTAFTMKNGNRPLAKVLSRSLYSNIFEDYQLLINN